MPATSELLQEGRYRIDAPLASTSGSSVFRGYDTVRDTKVVVKEIVAGAENAAQQETVKHSFANQAKMLASVKHDSLVHVEDFFYETDKPYLVLEDVDGDDLESALKANGGPFAPKEAVAWADQILDALHYLHGLETPLFHKFVRPKNLRRLQSGKVKLLAHGMRSKTGSVTTSIAPEGDDPSVLNYSPLEIIWDGLDSASQKVIVSGYDDQSEKILKSPADARSDVYSVGATLYYMLTGKVPVDALERSIEMLDGKADPLAKISAVLPSVPEQVADVIARAMMIRREDRYGSASEMRIALRAAIVRAEEGPADEDRELEEAADALRKAEKARQEQIQKAVELKARELEAQKNRELEEEKRRQEELLQQKLREADELRQAAEKRAAEAERLLKEEAAKAAAAEAAIHASQPEPAIHASQPEPAIHASQPEPAIHASQPEPAIHTSQAEKAIHTSQPERAIHTSQQAAPAEPEPLEENLLELSVAPNREGLHADDIVVALDELVEAEPAVEQARTGDTSRSENKYAADEKTFSYEETKSGSKLPLIAGAAAVLLLAIVGGWMMLGSGSAPQQAAPQQPAAPAHTAPAEQPAQTETQTGTSTVQSAAPADSQPEQPAAPAAEQEQTRTAAKPTPAKAAKPNAEPAKTPEKKKVTVDDLINDN